MKKRENTRSCNLIWTKEESVRFKFLIIISSDKLREYLFLQETFRTMFFSSDCTMNCKIHAKYFRVFHFVSFYKVYLDLLYLFQLVYLSVVFFAGSVRKKTLLNDISWMRTYQNIKPAITKYFTDGTKTILLKLTTYLVLIFFSSSSVDLSPFYISFYLFSTSYQYQIYAGFSASMRVFLVDKNEFLLVFFSNFASQRWKGKTACNLHLDFFDSLTFQ